MVLVARDRRAGTFAGMTSVGDMLVLPDGRGEREQFILAHISTNAGSCNSSRVTLEVLGCPVHACTRSQRCGQGSLPEPRGGGTRAGALRAPAAGRAA